MQDAEDIAFESLKLLNKIFEKPKPEPVPEESDMGGGGSNEPEQTVHTVEEVGWLHHAWDEVGPQLVTGASLILVALVGYLGVRYKATRKKKD